MGLLLKNNSPKGVSFGAEIFCVILGLIFLITGFFGNYIGFVIAAIIFLRQFARFCERASGTTEEDEVEEEYDETIKNALEKFKYYELINYIIIAVTFYYYLPKIMKQTDVVDGLIFAIIAFCGAWFSLKIQKFIYLFIVEFIKEYKNQE
ncbi:MAG: hypothetical protein IKB71_04060 [Lentisphaeria bacterium]|nr:hypothetical protein [Lentisphaeria bacterium]